VLKREFIVAGEYRYNQRGPIRWIISHLARYPLFLSGFILAILISNGLFALTPRLTGLAFDEVLQAAPDRGRLLTITLLVLGVVLVQGLIYLGASLSIEVLAQRLERDARDELYNTYFRHQSLDYNLPEAILS
jgi:ATP-binding cassette subfamily B protein